MASVALQFPSAEALLRPSPTPGSTPATSQPVTNSQTRPVSRKTKRTVSSLSTEVGQGDEGGKDKKSKGTKSRTGCKTCKSKRLKCGEEKPTCLHCQRRKVKCGGYEKTYKWAPVSYEAYNPTKPAKSRKTVQTQPSEQPSYSGWNQPSNTTPPSIQNDRSSVDIMESSSENDLPPLHDNLATMQVPLGNPSSNFPTDSNLVNAAHDLPPLSNDPLSPGWFGIGSPLSQQMGMPNLDHIAHDWTGPIHPIQPSNLSMQFNNNINPRFQQISDEGGPPVAGPQFLRNICAEGTDFSRSPDPSEPRPPPSPTPYMAGLIDIETDAQLAMDEDFDEEIVRDGMAEFNAISNPFSLIQPSIARFSPEGLARRYNSGACGILSVNDGTSENPWRTLMWPRAKDSPALYHALVSMAALHASGDDSELRIVGWEHKHRSLKHFAAEISNMTFDTALATALALTFSESWHEHTSTGIDHLKGAKSLVEQAIVAHRNYSSMGKRNHEAARRIKFLCNTFIYQDVIARLTSATETEEVSLEAILRSVNPNMDNMGQEIEVDPLLGCATTLFPLIGKAANLIQKVRKTKRNAFSIISEAEHLKTLIEEWQTPDGSIFKTPEDPSLHVDHCIKTAEAYRWATLLYLHQAVPQMDSESSETLADLVLQNIADVPESSRATIVQIFPLLAASCEVVKPDQRRWVTKRWSSMIDRLKIGNVDKCLVVIKEVWKRRDEYEMKKLNMSNQAHGHGNAKLPVSSLPFNLDNGRILLGDDGEMRDHIACERMTQRRLTTNVMDQLATTISNPGAHMSRIHPRRTGSDVLPTRNSMEDEYTVRGSLHWIGVMKDWDWEILLG